MRQVRKSSYPGQNNKVNILINKYSTLHLNWSVNKFHFEHDFGIRVAFEFGCQVKLTS